MENKKEKVINKIRHKDFEKNKAMITEKAKEWENDPYIKITLLEEGYKIEPINDLKIFASSINQAIDEASEKKIPIGYLLQVFEWAKKNLENYCEKNNKV